MEAGHAEAEGGSVLKSGGRLSVALSLSCRIESYECCTLLFFFGVA